MFNGKNADLAEDIMSNRAILYAMESGKETGQLCHRTE